MEDVNKKATEAVYRTMRSTVRWDCSTEYDAWYSTERTKTSPCKAVGRRNTCFKRRMAVDCTGKKTNHFSTELYHKARKKWHPWVLSTSVGLIESTNHRALRHGYTQKISTKKPLLGHLHYLTMKVAFNVTKILSFDSSCYTLRSIQSFKNFLKRIIIYYLPVSYTHLTLPTIYSV